MSIRADNVRGLLDLFICLAVLTIIALRSFLYLTGYPQIGGGGLHIAHMLWGGLLMLTALILEQSIIVRWARRLGAILGGIGFGLFIDELGKFITKDNDYFFQPTFALIYVLFILIYFLTRHLLRAKPFTPLESLVNAVDYLKEAAVGEMDEKDKRRAMQHLDEVPPENALKEPLTRFLGEFQAATRPPFFWERISRWFYLKYLKMISSPIFSKFIALVFLGVALYEIFNLRFTVSSLWNLERFQLSEWATFLSSMAAFFLILIGDVQLLRRKRAFAYRWFERALLVAILIGQVFVFYKVQLRGILWLALLVFFLVALRLLMAQEERLQLATPSHPLPLP